MPVSKARVKNLEKKFLGSQREKWNFCLKRAELVKRKKGESIEDVARQLYFGKGIIG